MKNEELIKAMRRLRDDMTGKIRECDGCGHEYGCSVHGCAIINEAIAKLQLLARDIDVLTKERDAYARAFRITTSYEPLMNHAVVKVDYNTVNDCDHDELMRAIAYRLARTIEDARSTGG